MCQMQCVRCDVWNAIYNYYSIVLYYCTNQLFSTWLFIHWTDFKNLWSCMPQWLFCIIYNIILLIFYFYCDLLSKSQCVTHTIAWTTRKIKLSLHNVFICVSISRPDLAWYLVVNPYMLEGWSNKCLGWWNFKHIPCIFKAYLKFISDIFLATLTLIFFIHMNLGKIIPPSFQHCQCSHH